MVWKKVFVDAVIKNTNKFIFLATAAKKSRKKMQQLHIQIQTLKTFISNSKKKLDNRVRLCKLIAKLLENGKNKFYFCLISP